MKVLDFEHPRVAHGSVIGDEPILFSRDGNGIIYPVREGQDGQPVAAAPGRKSGKAAYRFRSEFIRCYDYSNDDKQLAIIRGHREADVVVPREAEVTSVLSV